MRQTYIHKYAPMREIGQYMNREHPGAPVFLADGSDIVRIQRRGLRRTAGISIQRVGPPAAGTHSAGTLGRILTGWNVHYVAAPKPAPWIRIEPRTLQELLNECATPEFQTTRLFSGADRRGCRRVDPVEAPAPRCSLEYTTISTRRSCLDGPLDPRHGMGARPSAYPDLYQLAGFRSYVWPSRAVR